MEIYAQNEAFIEKDGDIEFDHTKVILRKNDRFFYATSKRRLFPESKFEFDPLDLTEIPADEVWPEIGFSFTSAPNPLPPNCYVKQPALIEYGDAPASSNPGALLLQEARICEVLRKSPHTNIARFLGCIVEGKRLKGLCFVKYPMTLIAAVERSTPLDIEACLQGLEAGVHHLHGLGLVHNDLNPSNIMMDDNIPIIIDFDSCRTEGANLGLKGGTVGWDTCDTNLSERENDLKALSQIRTFLEETRHCN